MYDIDANFHQNMSFLALSQSRLDLLPTTNLDIAFTTFTLLSDIPLDYNSDTF